MQSQRVQSLKRNSTRCAKLYSLYPHHHLNRMFTKKYFQDRPILFLNLVVILGAIINVIAVSLRIDTSRTAAIIRYESELGLSGFPKGTVTDLYGFAIVAVLAAIVAIILSARLYTQRRSLSLAVLSLTIIALLFNLIVSGAILNLQ